MPGTSRRPSRVAPGSSVKRGLVLLLAAVVWPGTPQFLAGRRTLGAAVMGVVALAWLGLGFVWVVLRPTRVDLFSWFTSPLFLSAGRWVLLIGLIAWFLLFVDTWWLASLPGSGRLATSFVAAVSVLVIALTSIGGFFSWNAMSASKNLITSVFTGEIVSSPLKGRYNIALLGSDSGKGRVGSRLDSVHVASIDAETGATVLITLPRNLQNVPFSEGSPLWDVYPYGFNCGDECLLNALPTFVADRTDLYPEGTNVEVAAMIDAIEGVTGLEINHHIVVNMKGFSKLIDAVGGVVLNIPEPLAMFGSTDAWRNTYIPAGRQLLNGHDALWCARSRVQSDDFERIGRQKCLLQALANQISPQTILLNAGKISESSSEMLSTDIPSVSLAAFADLALKARNQPVATFSVVPPLYSVQSPDFELIRSDIAAAVAKSEWRAKAPKPTSSLTVTPTPGPTVTPGESPATPSQTKNNTDDLAAVC